MSGSKPAPSILRRLGRVAVKGFALIVCMVICLVVGRETAPVALSLPGPPPASFVDDGGKLQEEDRLAALIARDPIAFLEDCLRRQIREVHGYSGVMTKQERINGKTHPPEVIDIWFREKPYSVLMKWREGARDAKATLYVEGQNQNRSAVYTNTKIPLTVNIDPDGKAAKGGGRYTMREFSMRQGMERVRREWLAAKARGEEVKVEYLGKKPVPELDNRVCYLLKRTALPPIDDGVVTLELAIDAETGLQLGSKLSDVDGKLIGSYYFSNLKVNPEFEADQFDRSRLKK